MKTNDIVILESIYNSIIESRETQRLLRRFAMIPFTNAPHLEVHHARCNDVEKLNGPTETIECVVSLETMQKYLVPRNNGFLVPVPINQTKHRAGDKIADNWKIIHITNEQLSLILDKLESKKNLLWMIFIQMLKR